MGGLGGSRSLNSGFGQKKEKEKKCPPDFHGENGRRRFVLLKKGKSDFGVKFLSVMIGPKLLVQPHFSSNKNAYHY